MLTTLMIRFCAVAKTAWIEWKKVAIMERKMLKIEVKREEMLSVTEDIVTVGMWNWFS